MKKDEDIKPVTPASTSENTQDENKEENQDSAPASVASPGQILKKAREEKGLSIKQVATDLKLKCTIVEQLESDSLDDKLHTPTFVRGYLCSYAKLIGIPVNEVSDVYDLHHDATKSYDVSMQSFSHKTKIKESDSRIMLVTWILVACLIVLSLVWWWQNREETVLTDIVTQEIQVQEPSLEEITQDIDVIDAANQPVAETNAKTQEENIPQSETQKPENSVTPVTDNAAEETSLQVTVKTENESAKKIETVKKKQEVNIHSGRIVFKGDCWINVRGADGKSLITGVKKEGTTSDFSGLPPFKIVLGAPSNVELYYEGKKVDLTAYDKKGKVARLSLGEEEN